MKFTLIFHIVKYVVFLIEISGFKGLTV